MSHDGDERNLPLPLPALVTFQKLFQTQKRSVSDIKTLCFRRKNKVSQAQKQSVSITKNKYGGCSFEMLLKAFAYFFGWSFLSTGSTLKSQAENHSGCEVSPVNSGSVETP